jgi:hypothetical protein
MAAHKTQSTKLADIVVQIMVLNGQSDVLQAKADADREIGRNLMQGAFEGMGMSPCGTGWAGDQGPMMPNGQMPMESSGAEGLWGDRPWRPKNVVLDLSDAAAADMLPPWYVDGFTGEELFKPGALKVENV